jgi:hypothetical protein
VYKVLAGRPEHAPPAPLTSHKATGEEFRCNLAAFVSLLKSRDQPLRQNGQLLVLVHCSMHQITACACTSALE